MDEIRPINDSSLDDAVALMCDAYPGSVRAGADPERVLQYMRDALRDTRISFHGMFRDHRLVGFMRFHNFRINVRGTMLSGGGVGGVAVNLAHKKQGIAKAMMHHYLRHYRNMGTPIALLWPFRPDFYHNMGFGYGAKMFRYIVSPEHLPPSPERSHCRFLTAADLPQLIGCHNAIAAQRHGMVEENEHTFLRSFRPERMHKLLGFIADGVLEGYAEMAFTNFDPANFIKYDLRVHHMLYLSPRALAGMLGFLHTQLDQVRRVLISSPDDAFHYLMGDPRDHSDVLEQPVFHQTNTAGVGIMFRVLDIDHLCAQFTEPAFADDNLTIGLTVQDSFLPEHDGRRILRFQKGHVTVDPAAKPDLEIRLPVAELSSLLMGVVPFSKLHEYGIAEIDRPEHALRVTRLFETPEPPLCLSSF